MPLTNRGGKKNIGRRRASWGCIHFLWSYIIRFNVFFSPFFSSSFSSSIEPPCDYPTISSPNLNTSPSPNTSHSHCLNTSPSTCLGPSPHPVPSFSGVYIRCDLVTGPIWGQGALLSCWFMGFVRVFDRRRQICLLKVLVTYWCMLFHEICLS